MFEQGFIKELRREELLELMKRRRNMVAVCKAWYDIGLSYLYRDIIIARDSKLVALVCTMREHPGRLNFVRSLFVHYNDPFHQFDCTVLVTM